MEPYDECLNRIEAIKKDLGAVSLLVDGQFSQELFTRLERALGALALATDELQHVKEALSRHKPPQAPSPENLAPYHEARVCFIEARLQQARSDLAYARRYSRYTPEQKAAILAEAQRVAIEEALKKQGRQ